jgi:hypothetical protein
MPNTTKKKSSKSIQAPRKKSTNSRKPIQPVELTRIRIVDHTKRSQIEESQDGSKQGRTRTTHDIRGFTLVNKDTESDLEVAYSVDPKEQYFLLAVIYDSGDSFGYDEGYIDFVGFYRTFDEAETNALRIRKHYNESYYDDKLLLISPSGKEYQAGTPWKGWMSKLDQIFVIPVKEALEIKQY